MEDRRFDDLCDDDIILRPSWSAKVRANFRAKLDEIKMMEEAISHQMRQLERDGKLI